jgi:hypothetical protein
MVTYDQAREKVQSILDARPGGPYVITRSQEYPVVWVFHWDSRKHQESGEFAHRIIGVTQILIDRDTGQVCPMGLNRPRVNHAAAYTDRNRHLQGIWPDLLDARFLTLLSLVCDGDSLYTAWKLEELISTLHPQREDVTVLEELIELERRGIVSRREGAMATCGRLPRPVWKY